MSKSKSHSNKKRKRDRKSRSLSSSEDQQLEQGYRNQYIDELRDEIKVDDTDCPKNRKKKKRKKEKRTATNEQDCKENQPSLELVDGKDNSDGRNDTIEPARKSASAVQQGQENSTTELKRLPKKRNKKKKKKKRSQQILSSSAGSTHDNDAKSNIDSKNEATTYDLNEDEIVLEGSMVSDILVLIDRKNGRVYSATEEPLPNGERKQVGSLDGKGQVVLFRKTEERENDSESSPDANENPSSTFPYEVDPDDHCESPLEAYEDIVPLLESYRQWIRKDSNSELSIYDPYFCNGRVARHLESLGFPEVYNRKEDCYKVWKDPVLYPSYDVFLTNPPYSADHIEKLMKHVTGKQNKNKPWLLLMPNFVHKKDYFQQLTANANQLPIYLVPKKRYIYQPPPNMRVKKASSTHKKSSPFVSMWYLWGGNREVTDKWYRVLQNEHSTTFDIARSKSALRDLRRKPKRK